MRKIFAPLVCLMIAGPAMAAESAGTASGTGASTNSGINKEKSSEPRKIDNSYGKGKKKENSQGNVPYAGSQGQQEDGATPSNPPRK